MLVNRALTQFFLPEPSSHYECRRLSQNEFVTHFGVPSDDPRHPDQGTNQQEGIHSAYMFQNPETSGNGIHLINIDARYHRSPTYTDYGVCEGETSTMLGDDQWSWLERELLDRESEIKIIGSGIQVLPPTHHGRSLTDYCAYDGSGGTFDQSNDVLNEGPDVSGTSYESWAEIPQERTRLLHLAQESINAGKAKQVIFLSGDQHWAEIMVKDVPARSGQPAVHLYEVTASGIDQNWDYEVPNPVRFNPSSSNNDVISYDASGEHACTNSDYHVCTAQANYGSVEVDWASREVRMRIYTPHERTPLAAELKIYLDRQ